MWNGRGRVSCAENENLEKLKVESSLGEVTERQNGSRGCLAGCATASTTAKTAEATDQTTGRYLLEIDR